MNTKKYIEMVNRAVKEGKFNRPIKVVYTKNRPITEGQQGVASHINMKKYDRVAIWKGLPRNYEEKIKREKELREKLGKNVKVITRDDALRHELWHIHKPYASEKEIRYKLERKDLPNKLPTRRRF